MLITYRSLWVNIASLGALQAFNFLLTLATLPYLTRTLGVSGWGTVVFIQLVINYLVWVANWGFYLGATKAISSERNNRDSLSRIFAATWIAQWCLTVGSLIVLVICAFIFKSVEKQFDLYIAGAGLLIGNVLMPLWFLNGLERIRESAMIQIAVKLVALPFIFLCINGKDDVGTYLWISSASSVSIGLVVAIWVYRSGMIDVTMPRCKEIYSAVANHGLLFLSSMLSNVNSSMVPTMLGILGDSIQLGYFSLADRARSAAITILHPIAHALFPRMCYLFSKERGAALNLIKYSFLGMVGIASFMSFILFFFSEQIAITLGGVSFQEANVALQWLSLTPVLTTLSAFLIHQILIPSGNFRGVLIATSCALALNASLVYPAVTTYGAAGGAAVVVLTEVFLAILLIAYIRTRRALIVLESFEKP